MSQVPIKITLICEPVVERDIENALMNSGLQFTKEEIKEPVEGYVIYIPSIIGAFSVALHILDSKKDVIKGSIELSDGKRFELTEDGRAQLREILIEALNKKRETTTDIETIWWTPFIPEIKDLFRAFTSLVEWYPRASGEGKNIITRNFLLLIGVIVLGMGILTFYGKVSGDSFALVIGTLLGYVFAFLQKYLGILVED